MDTALNYDVSARKVASKIDETRRKVDLQAKVAASARRNYDHSTSIADHLEEHALEEREAANLRQLARERATTVLLTSDEVLLSTEAQLAEAQKGAAEASEAARASREKADRLAREADNVQHLEPFQVEVEMATEIREYNRRCLPNLCVDT